LLGKLSSKIILVLVHMNLESLNYVIEFN
jgi:hypothetical protein